MEDGTITLVRRWLCPLLVAVAFVGVVSPAQARGGSRCDRPFTTGQQSTLTIMSGGAARTVVVYAPTGYDGRRRVPLVLNLHGSQSDAAEQMLRSELARTAERETFVVAAPQGLLPAPPGFRWNVPGVTTTDPNAPDDERFLDDLLDHLQAVLCIDARRVYGAGYSGGGRMISQYACDRPERLAAIAPVAGLRAGVPIAGAQGPQPDRASCDPPRPVPVITFQGTSDPVNPFAGGGLPYWQYGVPAAQARWAEINGCRRGPRTQSVTRHVSRVAYTACRRDADVVMYLVDGGGHTWPGSVAMVPLVPFLGPVTFEIDAATRMWRFFERYRLPASRR